MSNKVLITGLNDNSIELHVVDFLLSEYINCYMAIGTIDKIIEKIETVCELHQIKSVIVDHKTLGTDLLERLKEKKYI